MPQRYQGSSLLNPPTRPNPLPFLQALNPQIAAAPKTKHPAIHCQQLEVSSGSARAQGLCRTAVPVPFDHGSCCARSFAGTQLHRCPCVL
jgi:hypothetical protein